MPVVGYEGLYEVSDQGRVFSCPRTTSRGNSTYRVQGKELTPAPLGRSRGHLVVNLCRNGIQRTAYVHRLVLEAFVGPCPPGMEACHANDISGDNRLVNLRWDTSSANHFDAVNNGRHHWASKTVCDKHGQEYHTQPSGRRYCKACKSEWNAKYNNKNRVVI